MTYLLVLSALTVVPLLVIVLLRVNASIAFMSLALGSLLVTYAAPDINAVFGGFSASNGLDKYQWVKLGLLTLPFLLTVFFTRKNVSGSKQWLNIVPALMSGLLFTLLATPLLPADVQRHIHAQAAWKQLDNLETAVVLGGAVFALLFLLMTHHRRHDDDKKHK